MEWEPGFNLCVESANELMLFFGRGMREWCLICESCNGFMIELTVPAEDQIQRILIDCFVLIATHAD
jgi:hypothetical protein